MTVTAVQTKTGHEIRYTMEDYILAAEAILRTHKSIRENYSLQNVVTILHITHGTLALTIHSLRAALELSHWHKDTLGMAIHLASECYKNIVWTNANNS
jgi:hypothetical protein